MSTPQRAQTLPFFRSGWTVGFARGLVIAALLTSFAAAHMEEVKLEARVRGSDLLVRASSPDGYPIQGAKLEYRLESGQGVADRQPMREGTNGEYRVPRPDVPAGEYTLVVRDTTFPDEATEATATVRWPLQGPVALVLPPEEEPAQAQGFPMLPVLSAVLAGMALVALAWWQRRRSRTV